MATIPPNYDAAIASLTRTFGTLDRDVLISILDLCNGDPKAAAVFLQAQDGKGYDARQLQNNDGIPADYPTKKVTSSSSSGPISPPQTKLQVEAKTSPQVDSLKALFIQENSLFQSHYDNQKSNNEMYVGLLLLFLQQGVEIKQGARSRILAAAWARSDRILTGVLLEKFPDSFGLPQILGAVHLLDAGRKVRQLEKKIARLEKQGASKNRITPLRSQITELKREPHLGSVSGALARYIQNWARQISKEQLEFFALNLPKAPWMELADIVHFSPNDFQCSWFLPFTFGKDAPEDSIISLCRNLTTENLVSVLSKIQIPYSYLRIHVKPIPEEAKIKIATYSPIDIVLWYYEELANGDVDRVISARLDKESPSFGYGKLMERLLYLKSIRSPFFEKLIPLAEQRLKSIRLQLEAPVVVFGDASYSMDVAIRVSTVIASVLTILCKAELKFFTGESVDPPCVPSSIPEVLAVTTQMKADGLTAPAAALYPYYMKKKIVKFFVIVTDEIENEKYKDYYFPTLFYKYYTEIYPARIVFVSFLENPSEKGRMVTALESLGIVPLQYKLDGKRPDLTKLDSLLGSLASESSFFADHVSESASLVKSFGASEALNKMKSFHNDEVSTPSSTTQSETKTKPNKNNNNNNVTPKPPKEKKKPKEKKIKSDGKEEEEKKPKKEKNPSASKKKKKKQTISEEKKSEETKNEEKNEKICIICEEKESTMALIPCGHASFCEGCSTSLKECPLCRKPVSSILRIFQN